MRREGGTCDRATADDVEHAWWQHAGEQLGGPDGRCRGELGRLEHHGVPGRDRGGPFPGGHHERVVPGCDGAADPDRLAAHARGQPVLVLPDRPALEQAGRTGEEPQLVQGRRDLVGSSTTRRGLPVSRTSRSASSSACAASRSATASSASIRARGVVRRQVANADPRRGTRGRRRPHPSRPPRPTARRHRVQGGQAVTGRRRRQLAAHHVAEERQALRSLTVTALRRSSRCWTRPSRRG